jgi:hypothetical protein
MDLSSLFPQKKSPLMMPSSVPVLESSAISLWRISKIYKFVLSAGWRRNVSMDFPLQTLVLFQ